ncbi:MAG: glutamyl-tRNA reductase [Planctomycetaceae bacterium]|nr:glutamyl-tRNA reductase [Planctomycetaceae bacterium]
MLVEVVGCSHHGAEVSVREQLAFGPEQMREALDRWRREFPGVEAALVSTCNRVEWYAAAEPGPAPTFDEIAGFLARFHGLETGRIVQHLYWYDDRSAVRHLFAVAASLDSMVLGESQILAQVKQAYQTAAERDGAGPLLHAVFQAALRTAHRVADETAIHQRRVSVPSVAVADVAGQIFERFDDKKTLVIGAGETAEECLRYLREAGVRDVTVVNRRVDRAERLAGPQGRVVAWERLPEAMAEADLIVSATGSERPIVAAADFAAVEARRPRRPLLILDLAVPRDFEPVIGQRPDVYLYSIDDLQAACRRNAAERDKELPAAWRIVEQETDRFISEMYHREVGPVVERLRQDWQRPKEEELQRLLNKLPELDDRAKDEIGRSFDRLVNKLLHPPLESLRDESQTGVPRGLLEAMKRLFQLKD